MLFFKFFLSVSEKDGNAVALFIVSLNFLIFCGNKGKNIIHPASSNSENHLISKTVIPLVKNILCSTLLGFLYSLLFFALLVF